MKGITSKWKIWSVLFVVIVFVGMVLLGVTGFNKSIDAKEHYEIKVTATDIQAADTDDLRIAVENYFKQEKATPVWDATEVYNSGETIVYKFYDNAENLVAGVKSASDTALSGKGIEVSVNLNVVKPTLMGGIVNSCTAFAVFTAIIFVITLGFDKIKNALTVILSGFFTSLLAISIATITRLAVGATFIPIVLTGAVLSNIITVLVTKTARKNMLENEKSCAFKSIELATAKTASAIFLGLGALIVASLVFVILGGALLKNIGLVTIVTVISTAFTVYALAPTVWAFMHGKKGDVE